MPQPKLKVLPATLSRDQYEALAQVSVMPKGAKPSACVARNAKQLVGTKYLVPRRDGTFGLTEKGAGALFTRNCIIGLRAVAEASDETPLNLTADVVAFLSRKGYIVVNDAKGIDITDKGRECLADIDANG
jgi:hypothetical protein